MSNHSSNPWTTLTTKEVYASPWIKVEHHDVLNPAGKPGTYSVVRFNSWAIGIVPIDEQGYTWIVGQYRYPLECYTWEIPEGGGNKSGTPLEAAQRELVEECGIIAETFKCIQELQLSNSATDEVAYLFVATNLSFTQSRPEENEQLSVKKVHFDELYTLVANGSITDSLSVAAVLKIQLMRLEGMLTIQPLIE
ncbi:MAG: NUDIX hydrolase [Bacteroidia bacterium]|jgi:8-oxo-dGTP pyrophosphatase MutT (NUDIX family)|nr:NUDIX hydrolase [Bacteroidia bacterium]